VAGERILIVDDQAAMRRTIVRMLSSQSYDLAEAESVAAARAALKSDDFDLVLCDVNMGGESGLTLVAELEAAVGETAVLMVTGIDDPEVAHKAALLGSSGWLVKPFTINELLINVDGALQEARRRGDTGEAERERERQRISEVQGAIEPLEEEARAADRQAAELLRPLSEAVGRRDLETGAHIARIGESSALLAEASGMQEEQVEAIRLAAPMHDIGKVAIPDAVLLKPGPLNDHERELVERHAQIGHDILSGSESPLLQLAAEIALTHQEKVDGSGYPRGLEGEEIPIPGRIVAVADVFDALTSDRPYRDALSVEDAVEIMVEGRGSHFDQELLDLFLGRLDDVRALASGYSDSRQTS
jgi:putative two-component system response regulator